MSDTSSSSKNACPATPVNKVRSPSRFNVAPERLSRRKCSVSVDKTVATRSCMAALVNALLLRSRSRNVVLRCSAMKIQTKQQFNVLCVCSLEKRSYRLQSPKQSNASLPLDTRVAIP